MKTFKESTVRHSFKHCGLWPFDPEVICKELRLEDGPMLVVYDRGKEYELPEYGNGPESDGKRKGKVVYQMHPTPELHQHQVLRSIRHQKRL